MFRLSKRLSLAASYVKTGSCVCDVGTDHGYLPVFLYKSGICKSVCATEINKKPLYNAKSTFEKYNADIDIYLCDGIEAVPKDKIQTVIITGMGGDVISGIIDRAPVLFKEGINLILQPMTAARELREYLSSKGFKVCREEAVVDTNRVYSVMDVSYTGVSYTLSPALYRIGILKPDSEANIVYIKRQKRLIEELLNKLENVPDKRDLYEFEKKALEQINNYLG